MSCCENEGEIEVGDCYRCCAIRYRREGSRLVLSMSCSRTESRLKSDGDVDVGIVSEVCLMGSWLRDVLMKKRSMAI